MKYTITILIFLVAFSVSATKKIDGDEKKAKKELIKKENVKAIVKEIPRTRKAMRCMTYDVSKLNVHLNTGTKIKTANK